MTALPSKSAFTGPSVTEGEFKTAIETQHDYLTGLLGTAGTQAAALAALGVLGGSVSTRSTAYAVVAADRGHLILCSETFTLSLSSAVTLGAGFAVAVVNTGTGVITVDPAGTETVGGKAALTLAVGASAILICDGAGWQFVGGGASSERGYQLFTASGTFNVPPGVTKVKATVIGGGGGGGRGNTYTTSTGTGDGVSYYDVHTYGGAGGAGGQYVGYVSVNPGDVLTVTVGSGGAGSNSSSGSNGLASIFSGITAGGGFGGAASVGSADGVSGATGSVPAGGFGIGGGTYMQTSRDRGASATGPVAYSASGIFFPGAGGLGEYSYGGNNASGGVGGLVLIEW
jgi:hypothetical protein